MEDNLEVVELTKRYGCPICKKVYDWKEDAQKCFEQGIIGEGPEIKPGLVVKINDSISIDFTSTHRIFTGEILDEHYIKEEFWVLKYHLKKKIFSKSEKSYSLVPFENNIKKSWLEREIRNEKISLLSEEEFGNVSEMLGKFSEYYLPESDIFNALNNLYRYHEFFDKK